MRRLFNVENKLNAILKILIILVLFIFTFSIASFGEQNFKKIPIFNYGFYLTYASMFLLFASTIFYLIKFKCKIRINPTVLCVPFFTLFALIGTLLYSKQIREWITLVLLCFSFFAFIYSFRIINNKHFILSIISFALFSFTIFYLAYYGKNMFDFRGFLNGKNRLGTDFDNQNGVATYAVASFAIALYLFLFSKCKFRFFFLLPAFTSGWVGVSTGSRTFLITAYLIALLLLFFFFSKYRIVFIVSSIIITILIIIGFNSLFENRLLSAFQTLFGVSTKTDTATVSRELYLDYGLLLGSRNIIFGFGVKGFGIISGVGTYAHNNYAEVFCDFGVIGFILFYLPLLMFAIQALRNKRIDRSFVLTFIIYYLVASFSNVLYYKKLYFLILAVLYYLTFDEPYSLKKVSLIKKLDNVLFTCDTMRCGGAERVISILANEMAAKDVKVSIIGVGETGSTESFYELNNQISYFKLTNKNGKKLNPFAKIFALRKKILSIKPDLVISFLPNANVYTFISLIGIDTPYIVSERNNPYVDPKEKTIRFLKKISFNFANGCIFQTNKALEFYSNNIREKSIIISNPITLNAEPMNSIEKRNKVVLAVGRLVAQKNYKCLLDAFKIFNENNHMEFKLKIYGDGPLKGELIKYSSNIGINKNVLFEGNKSDWQKYERNDSMYVLSSNYEGIPNSLAEAMALGIPSISTDCPIGGPSELITDNYNGFLVPVNNPEVLAQKMNDILGKTQIFAANNQKMIKDYSPKKIADKWIEFIISLKKDIYA